MSSHPSGRSTPEPTLDELTEVRRQIDEALDEIADETSYQEVLAALDATRDTILVNGRVPDWYGDAGSPHYREMCWGYY